MENEENLKNAIDFVVQVFNLDKKDFLEQLVKDLKKDPFSFNSDEKIMFLENLILKEGR